MAKKPLVKRKLSTKKKLPVHVPLKTIIAASAALALLEVVLIYFEILPPALSYSPGNLLFSLGMLALVAYAGFASAQQGLGKAVLNGAAVSIAASLTLSISSIVLKTCGRPILGISAADQLSVYLLLVLIILENTLLGAIIAALAALARRFTKH